MYIRMYVCTVYTDNVEKLVQINAYICTLPQATNGKCKVTTTLSVTHYSKIPLFKKIIFLPIVASVSNRAVAFAAIHEKLFPLSHTTEKTWTSEVLHRLKVMHPATVMSLISTKVAG